MNTLILLSLSILLIALCLRGLWFYSYGIYAAIDHLTQAETAIDPEFYPHLTLLLPLDQIDSDTDIRLRSICQQNYPGYQIIFKVPNAAAATVAIVDKLSQEFPERHIRWMTEAQLQTSQERLQPARHSLWVIADSKICVDANYLQQIVQPFRYPSIGIASCLCRSRVSGWFTAVAALGTATEFHPAVLMARHCGRSVILHSTLAIRQELLSQIGGIERLTVAIRQETLGNLAAHYGYRTTLSSYVVELASNCDRSSWRSLYQSMRSNQTLTQGTAYSAVVSLLVLGLLQGASFAWFWVAGIWLSRLALGWFVSVRCLQDATIRRYWWLMPFSDLCSLLFWVYRQLADLINPPKLTLSQSNFTGTSRSEAEPVKAVW